MCGRVFPYPEDGAPSSSSGSSPRVATPSTSASASWDATPLTGVMHRESMNCFHKACKDSAVPFLKYSNCSSARGKRTVHYPHNQSSTQFIISFFSVKKKLVVLFKATQIDYINLTKTEMTTTITSILVNIN